MAINSTVTVTDATSIQLKPAMASELIVLSNAGHNDVFLAIGDDATKNSGIRLGGINSAYSAVTSRIMFDHNSKVHSEINAIAATASSAVLVFYR